MAKWILAAAIVGSLITTQKALVAQEVAAPVRAGRAAPGGANVVVPGAAGAPPGNAVPGNAVPGNGAPGNGAPGNAEGKPGEAPKTEAPKVTPRPTTPPTPANPEELNIQPDSNGMVRFNFRGQPWLGVLEWLARISNQSLDWQEVPSDFLNLRTQRRYTIDEARDLINRHLLDRGFTLVRHGEVLSIYNVKKLDPSLVPRVRPEDLENRDPHEFVKVSFPIDWLIAEKAVEELKPLLSPNGKLTALKSTNRVEAIDAVANLREIRVLLSEEQSHQGRERLVREFKLNHVRAAEVVDQLQDLLGLEKKAANAGPMTPEQQMMQQQQMMMRQQQMQQGQPQQPAKQKPDVHLVINQRENSIVANAPTDQMAIIVEAVGMLDVPTDRSRSLLKNATRVAVYRLAAVDPEALVKMLKELGELDPTTRVDVDKKNRALIVNGSLADHMLIRTLVTRLDGTDRRFDVIKLRRLEADYVAGTIEFMMGGGDKNKQQNNRYSPFYYDFYNRRSEPEEESKKFRVDADVENNRLLVYANDVELAEIQNLLVKLGEIPATGGNPSTIRVIESIDPADAEELLRRIQKTWPGLAPNRLELGPGTRSLNEAEPAAAEPPPAKPAVRKPVAPGRTTDGSPPRPNSPAAHRANDSSLQLVSQSDGGAHRALADARTEFARIDDDASQSATDDEPRGAGEVDERLEEGPVDVPAARRPAANSGVEIESSPAPATPPGAPRSRSVVTTPAEAAPIRIGRGPDGRVMISSEDPAALDQLEELIIQLAPPRRDYKVFKMKYKSTWVYGVAENLKDFFEDGDKKSKNNGRSWDPWYGGWRNDQSSDTSGRRLSKRRPLKFIVDVDSNSILVTGADQAQLKLIEDLISLYDVPESKDPQATRLTKVYTVRYSKSRIIAEAVKDVYRDLLSTNDPAMQNQNNQKNEKTSERSFTYIYNTGGNDEKKPEAPVRFKGALSLGIDELSNTLIVSAGEGLLLSVMDTIRELDEAARPATPRMQVIQLNRNIDVGEVQKRLTKLTVKPQQKAPQQPQQPRQQQNGQPGGETTTVIDN